MPKFLRPLICLSLFGVVACDEAAISSDPSVRAEYRANRSCIAAVKKQTGSASVTANTTLPVVEENQFIIDVAGATSWTCYTDNSGKATELTELRTG